MWSRQSDKTYCSVQLVKHFVKLSSSLMHSCTGHVVGDALKKLLAARTDIMLLDDLGGPCRISALQVQIDGSDVVTLCSLELSSTLFLTRVAKVRKVVCLHLLDLWVRCLLGNLDSIVPPM